MNKWLPAALLALSLGLRAQTITPPVVKTQTQPEYPPELKYYLTEHPAVQLSIDEEGVPFALQSTLQLPDNVVRAIRRWRFEPARQGNRAVAVAVSAAVPVRRPLSEATSLRRRWTSTKEINDSYQTAKDLDEAGLAAFEQKIAQNPADLTSRLVVVRYTMRHDSAANAALRLHHIRWFAEINPGFELLGSPAATPCRDQAGSEDYEALRKLWLAKLADNPSDPAILDNATNFTRISDPVAAEDALAKAVNDPDHALVLLGELYAFAAMGVTAVDPDSGRPSDRQQQRAATPFAGQARELLSKTENMRLLFSGLNATSGAGDIAFCSALRERAKLYFADARANCETVAQANSGGGGIRIGVATLRHQV